MRAIDIKKRTEFFIRDLHARESMRLGLYRQFGIGEEKIRHIRERKAHHIAFLQDLLRKRGANPAWYARFFYLFGHAIGVFSALLPKTLMDRIEKTMEAWLLIRYQNYFQEMSMDANLRSMIESLQLKRMGHDEPAQDVMKLIQHYIKEQEQVLSLS